jgi:hypothetical protein
MSPATSFSADQNRGSFVRELLAALRSPAPRYTLYANLDGYCITERGEVIATIHGPQFELASRLLRMLQEDAS